MTNSTASVNFAGENDVGGKRPKSHSIRSASLSINQIGISHYEHRVSVPFSGTPHAVFKKGNIVLGILCPSLTSSFR
jgi:hypothetical protein